MQKRIQDSQGRGSQRTGPCLKSITRGDVKVILSKEDKRQLKILMDVQVICNELEKILRGGSALTVYFWKDYLKQKVNEL